jgi:hypothetical protein
LSSVRRKDQQGCGAKIENLPTQQAQHFCCTITTIKNKDVCQNCSEAQYFPAMLSLHIMRLGQRPCTQYNENIIDTQQGGNSSQTTLFMVLLPLSKEDLAMMASLHVKPSHYDQLLSGTSPNVLSPWLPLDRQFEVRH